MFNGQELDFCYAIDIKHPKDVQIKNVKAITCAHLARINKIIEIFIKHLWKFQDFIESRLFAVRQMGLSSPSVADKAERTIS